jgi:hypothetical protein
MDSPRIGSTRTFATKPPDDRVLGGTREGLTRHGVARYIPRTQV